MFYLFDCCMELCYPSATPYDHPQHQGDEVTSSSSQTQAKGANSQATSNPHHINDIDGQAASRGCRDTVVSIQPSLKQQMAASKVEAQTIVPASPTTSPTTAIVREARKYSISALLPSPDKESGMVTPGSSSSDGTGFRTPSSKDSSRVTRSTRQVRFEEDGQAVEEGISKEFTEPRVRSEPVRKLC